MALPSFVKDATGLDDGVTNNLAASLEKLKAAKNGMDKQTKGMETALDTINPSNLPTLPPVAELNSAADTASSLADSKMSELSAVNDLAGSCLGGAMSSLKSVADNGYGLIEDALGAFNIPSMPNEMFNIFGIFGQAQQFAASLGMDKLIADLMSKLGCLSDSSMVADIQSEIDSTMDYLGLDSSGMPDDEVYYNKMKSDMASLSSSKGIDPAWSDSMSDGLGVMTTKSNELSASSKAAADSQISAAKQKVKDSVPPTPTPPSFF